MQRLSPRQRELGLYLVFGVLTTLVGWGVYYLILLGGRGLLGIPAEEVASGRYWALYTAAQLIQWVCAVLFAFFTNRKWVFADAGQNGTVSRQLLTFSAGRLVTLGLDYLLTGGLTLALAAWIPSWTSVNLFSHTWNLCEIASKVMAAVAVIVCNYLISKLLVFQRRTRA